MAVISADAAPEQSISSRDCGSIASMYIKPDPPHTYTSKTFRQFKNVKNTCICVLMCVPKKNDTQTANIPHTLATRAPRYWLSCIALITVGMCVNIITHQILMSYIHHTCAHAHTETMRTSREVTRLFTWG